MVTLNNTISMNAVLRSLTGNNTALQKTQDKLSTGLRVSSAQENASVFAVAQGIRSNIKSYTATMDTLRSLRGKFVAAQSAGHEAYDQLKQLKAAVINYVSAEGNSTARASYLEGINSIFDNINQLGRNTMVGKVDSSFSKIATYATPGTAYDIASDGTYIYCADYVGGGLEAYTLSNGTLTQIGIDATATARSLYLEGKNIFTADQAGTISAYTFDGTTFTKLASSGALGGGTTDVWGDGKYYYASSFNGGIVAFTFNGSSFTKIAQAGQNAVTGGHIWNSWGDGQYVYCADAQNGLYVYQFDGTKFSLAAQDLSIGGCRSVWGDGTYLYVGDNANTLHVYTFNQFALNEVGSLSLSNTVFNINGDGRDIYMADGGAVRCYQLINGNFVLQATSNGTAPRDITPDGDLLYVARATNIDVLRRTSSTAQVSIEIDPQGTSKTFTTHAMTTVGLGLGLSAPGDIGLSAATLDKVDDAMARAGQYMAEIGNNIKDIDNSIQSIQAIADATTEGLGGLVDADIAKVQAELVGDQLRQNLSISSLNEVTERNNHTLRTLFA